MGTLTEFLDRVKDKPYNWKTWNCSIYLKEYTGYEFPFKYTSEEEAIDVTEELGFYGVASVLDRDFSRVTFPWDGCLVLTEERGFPTVGIFYSGKVCLVGAKGLMYRLSRKDDLFWRVD